MSTRPFSNGPFSHGASSIANDLIGKEHPHNDLNTALIGGRFELIDRLSSGQLGDEVFRCREINQPFSAEMAIKLRTGRPAEEPQALERLQKEFFILSTVHHRHVLRGFEFIREPQCLAFTMELITGGTLADRLRRGPMPQGEVMRLLRQICSGAAAVHREGFLHCDLTPANILVTPEGDIKLSDFGIAQFLSSHEPVQAGPRLGTPDYASPEYLEHGVLSVALDIYSIGLIAFEMLTGCYPFEGRTMFEKMTQRLSSEVPSPKSLRPDCSETLARFVIKATRRNPEDRYSSAEAMIADLMTPEDPYSRLFVRAYALGKKCLQWLEKHGLVKAQTQRKSVSFVSDASSAVYTHAPVNPPFVRTSGKGSGEL